MKPNVQIAHRDFRRLIEDLDYILVVDLEATCGGHVTKEQTEIIQYGAVLVKMSDLSNERLRQFEVRPVLNPVLTKFCTELTGITQDMVNKGLSYGTGLEIVKQDVAAIPGEWMWCSWGAYDRNQMLQDSVLHRLPPFLPYDKHFNLKGEHGAFRGIKRGNGLAKATTLEGLKFEGIHHNALSDALTASNILKRMVYEVREDVQA